MIQHNIRRRILIPLGLALLTLAGVTIFSLQLHESREIYSDIIKQATATEKLFKSKLAEDAELMNGLISALTRDPCLKNSFQERNRERLLRCATPLFNEMRARHKITHFYFHTLDKINFLRVHNPSRHSDLIDRTTMANAVNTGETSSGIELGPFGNFALRVVHPWHLGNRLIGYIELGEEIEHIAPEIKRITGNDFITIIEKTHLQKAKWEEGLRTMGRKAEWNQLSRFAIIEDTFKHWPPKLIDFINQPQFGASDDNNRSLRFSVNSRQYHTLTLPLFDIGNQQLGNILVISDTTLQLSNSTQTLLIVTGTAVTIGLVLFILFGIYLGHIQQTLNQTQVQLEDKLEQHRQAESMLRQNETRLAREVAQRGKAAAEEHALSTLLRLSLQPLPIQEFLQQAINTLIDSVPWLRLLPKGSIFLTEGEGKGNRLTLIAQHNVSSEVQCLCAHVDFGNCLCGTAAATGETQFANCVDERHTIHYEGMPPHGHFSVPIRHEGLTLGVLLLYLPHGYEQQGEEAAFLERVTSVLSMGILHRYHEKHLDIARDEAIASSMAKSEFLATMSHEIRTPMNGILGMAELLQDAELTEEQQEYANIISQSGNNLLLIINDILDLSKIEAEHLQLSPIPFDLEVVAHEAIQLVAPKANDKALELLFYYAPECPRHLKGDAGRIRQILLNLLGNAIKFTEQGHVLVEIKGEMTSDDSAEIHIAVQDSGIGINAEQQARLFDPFTQADASTTRKYGGTGLGLAICKRLVNLMDGEIGIDSTPGKGSTFWFKLPLPLESPPKPLAQHRLENVHALLIDNSHLSQHILSNQLESLGIEVEIASSQEEALLMMETAEQTTRPFELVLFKHPIAGVNAGQLAQAIRAKRSSGKIPLILLTDSAQRGDAKFFTQAGFTAYLAAPVLLNSLHQVIAGTLGIQEEEGEEKQNTKRPLITSHYMAESPSKDNLDKLKFDARILLAEDNRINQKLTLSILNSLGIQAEVATNGEEAISHWEQNEYDLIFMDCQMPTLDGYKATQIIRSREGPKGHHIPIIALTANAMAHDREKCLEAGMDDYITKPFKTEDLAQALTEWLPENRQKTQPLES